MMKDVTRKEIEDEVNRVLQKRKVSLDSDVYDETIDYIQSFWDDDFPPASVKDGVSEWYNDTKRNFPDMFKSGNRVASSRHFNWVKSAYLEYIRSSRKPIKSSNNKNLPEDFYERVVKGKEIIDDYFAQDRKPRSEDDMWSVQEAMRYEAYGKRYKSVDDSGETFYHINYDEVNTKLENIFKSYVKETYPDRTFDNYVESSRKPIKSSVVEWSNSRWIAYVDDMRLFEKECQKRGISDFNNLDEFINFLKEIGFVWGDGSGHYFISPNHINSSEGYDPKTGRKIQPMGDDYQNWVDFANEHNVADLDYFGKVVFGDYGYKNPESNLPLDELNYDLKRYEKIKRYNNEEPFTMMSSRKPIKSSYDDAFTVYPWSDTVSATSNEDLGLSYVVETYGDEFVNLDERELEDMRDTLVMYFDDDAYVRDWNINYPDEPIEDAYDVIDPEELDVETLAMYFDYDAYGRDIQLENRMVWDSKRECWFSAIGIDQFENEDDIIFMRN